MNQGAFFTKKVVFYCGLKIVDRLKPPIELEMWFEILIHSKFHHFRSKMMCSVNNSLTSSVFSPKITLFWFESDDLTLNDVFSIKDLDAWAPSKCNKNIKISLDSFDFINLITNSRVRCFGRLKIKDVHRT